VADRTGRCAEQTCLKTSKANWLPKMMPIIQPTQVEKRCIGLTPGPINACMVRSQALLLKALADAPLLVADGHHRTCPERALSSSLSTSLRTLFSLWLERELRDRAGPKN